MHQPRAQHAEPSPSSEDDVRICALVPTYDNPRTVRSVVEALIARDLPVVVVDDGSGEEGREVCAQLAADGLATVVHHATNKGKGAACRTGFAEAQELGFTHAFQIDADGQHDLDAVPAFVEAAREQPRALILSYPEYDESAPRHRLVARQITHFWVGLEVGGKDRIRDGLIGFRVYPLQAVARLRGFGTGMEFDVDIAVRLVRAGVEPVNLPVKVHYHDREDGGVSHFRPVRDNLRLGWMHCRLCTLGCMRWTFCKLWPFGRRR